MGRTVLDQLSTITAPPTLNTKEVVLLDHKHITEGFNKKNVLRWMRNSKADFVECGEINCTKITEACAHAFGMDHEDGPLDCPDHWIWEVAVKVSNEEI